MKLTTKERNMRLATFKEMDNNKTQKRIADKRQEEVERKREANRAKAPEWFIEMCKNNNIKI